MRFLGIIFTVVLIVACQALAPVDAPINSCHLIESAKQSGGMLPGDMQEFNQCDYHCPNGQTKTRTQFGYCAPFISS